MHKGDRFDRWWALAAIITFILIDLRIPVF
jgi:hypothetical protein